jgi:predicted nucleic acid-binding protein
MRRIGRDSCVRRPIGSAAVLVVLDANVLIADFLRRSNPFQLLLGQAGRLDITVAVPEIVIAEAAGQHSIQLEAAQAKLRQAGGQLRRLGVELGDPFGGSTAGSIRERVKAWEEQLRVDVEAAGGIVPTLPTIPHGDILAWLRARQPPARDGSGYKDILVWESLVEVAPDSGVTVLVSNDGDFAEPEGERLAGHLVANFGRRHPDAAVELSTSLAAFVAAHVAKDLPLEEQFADALGGTELVWKIKEALADQLEANGLDPSLLAFEDAPSAQLAWLLSVEDISDFEIHDPRKSPDGRVFFDVIADVRLRVEYLVDRRPDARTPRRAQALPPVPSHLEHGVGSRDIMVFAEGSYRAGNRQLERVAIKDVKPAN